MESANCVVDVLWPTALSALALFWRLGWILIAVYVYRAPVRGLGRAPCGLGRVEARSPVCLVNGFADKVLCWSADRGSAGRRQSSQLTRSQVTFADLVSHSDSRVKVR